MVMVASSIQDAFKDMGVFQGQHGAIAAPAPQSPQPDRDAPASTSDLNALLQTAADVKAHQHGLGPRDLEPLKKDIEKALEEEIKKGAITLRAGPDGLIISLCELGFFDSGSSSMRSTAEPSFHRIAQLLASRQCGVRVEGHTDNVPIRSGTFKSNWDLSTARATEIVKSLIDRYNFEPALLSAAGYGEYHPIAPNSTAAGRAQNRRVDLVVLSHEDAERMMPTMRDTPVAQTDSAESAHRTAIPEQHP
jgi:chemotaxis protein MotB